MPTLPAIDAPGGAYRERAIVSGRTALLSIDMQQGEFNENLLIRARTAGTSESKKRDFYERIADVVLPNQARLQEAARNAGIEVIFTVIESLTRDGRDRSLDHKISAIHVPKGSPDAKVIAAVAPQGDEIVIPKTASGIFNATNVEYVLRNLNIEHLVVYGIVTDQCVEFDDPRRRGQRFPGDPGRRLLRRVYSGRSCGLHRLHARALLPYEDYVGADW